MSASELLTKLRSLKPSVMARYKAKEIGLFGSFVRGEEHAQSDIDVLVEFEDGADLLDLVGLSLFLEDEFQLKVDVVPKRALREGIREAVLQEVVVV